MSKYSDTFEDSEFWSLLYDGIWPTLSCHDGGQILLEPSASARVSIPPQVAVNNNVTTYCDNPKDNDGDHCSAGGGALAELQSSAQPQLDAGMAPDDWSTRLAKIGERDYYSKERSGDKKSGKAIIRNECGDAERDCGIGPSVIPSSTEVARKLNHNEKERIRRMKFNAAYLALRDLLPSDHSKRSSAKRIWSAPVAVDRAIKYIPELENEIESLRSKKTSILQSAAAASHNKDIVSAHDQNPTSL